ACAATIGASLGETVRRLGGVSARVPLRWLWAARTAPLMVFVDFGILAWVLARSLPRRRVVRGRFVANALPAGGGDPAVRAWVTLAATFSPNAYVVDISEEHGTALLHDLVAFRESEKPA